MSTVFPPSFWPLALVHALALLCPGSDFIIIVSQSARHRLRGSAYICLGIAAGHGLYIALAILGLGEMSAHPRLVRAMELAGAAYLLWIGIQLLRSPARERPGEAGAGPALTPGRQLCLGFGTAALNPKNMIFYLSIMTVLLDARATAGQRLAAGFWMVAVVLLWDMAVAAALSLPACQRRIWPAVPAVEKVCGGVLAGMAVLVAAGG